MTPYIILVGGIPASGKTTYGRHIAHKLRVPFIGKDDIKEKLHDVLQYDTSAEENSKLHGRAAYKVFYHVAESLMKSGTSFVAESNFPPFSAEILRPMVENYGYRALTVLLDADMEVLYMRCCQRDTTSERHPGLAGKFGPQYDFTAFCQEMSPIKDFCVGEKMVFDTTDFAKVDYNEIDARIIGFIGGKI